jgi:hypothetical protein
MMNRFICDADDFYVNVHLNTEMELPNNRDTVLHFFEQMKKRYPELQNFYTRENGDLVLEGDKSQESYRFMAIEPRRLCSGHFNPEALEDSFRQHELVLDVAPHLLTISLLDCEALDVMFGFDFRFDGNHDEVVAEAMGVGQGLEGIFDLPRAQVINFEPSLTLALDESCQLQCRLAVETRSTGFQVRAREFGHEQISVYFTVRQYWGSGPEITFLESMRRQREIGEEVLQNAVIPRIVRPLAQVIASR